MFVRVVFTKVPTLTISWTPITDFDYDISYTVWYSTSTGTSTEPSSGASTMSGITGTSTTPNGLAHGTTYYIWVAAISSVGEGPFSTRVTKRTYKGNTWKGTFYILICIYYYVRTYVCIFYVYYLYTSNNK